MDKDLRLGFNRINSCRSIPTINSGFFVLFQRSCFNRINSCRSIPTVEAPEDKNTEEKEFQSYQFMQINPDSYLWEASRGAVLRG